MAERKQKPKTWSRKGRCPSCYVATGSKHRAGCSFDYGEKKITKLNMMEHVKRLTHIKRETFVAPVSWVHGWFSLGGPNGKSVDVFEAPEGHSMETDHVDMYLVEGERGMMVEFESKVIVRRRFLVSELEETGVVEIHINE